MEMQVCLTQAGIGDCILIRCREHGALANILIGAFTGRETGAASEKLDTLRNELSSVEQYTACAKESYKERSMNL